MAIAGLQKRQNPKAWEDKGPEGEIKEERREPIPKKGIRRFFQILVAFYTKFNQIWVPFASKVTLPLDYRALALCRMCFAILQLYQLTTTMMEWRVWLADEGLCPRNKTLGVRFYLTWTVYGAVGSELPIFAMALCHYIVAFCYLIGYQLWIVQLLFWVFVHSMHVRLYAIGYGGDSLMTAYVFWMVFLPMGERWSVDSWKRGQRKRAMDDHMQTNGEELLLDPETGDTPSGLSPSLSPSKSSLPRKALAEGEEQSPFYTDPALHSLHWRGYILLIQLSLVYYSAGITKTGVAWKSGTAVQFVLQTGMAKEPLRSILLAMPGVCKLLTFLSLRLEEAGWTLLFIPVPSVRLFSTLAFLGFHTGMHFSLDAHNFQPIMCSALMAFLPGLGLDYVDRKLVKLTNFYRKSAPPLLRKLSTMLTQYMCPVFIPADIPTPNVITMTFQIGCYIVQRLVTLGLWILVYGIIKSNCNVVVTHKEPQLCITKGVPPTWMNSYMGFASLHQHFTMFGPDPGGIWWVTMPALLKDGRRKDIFCEGRINYDLTCGAPYSEAKFFPPPRYPWWHNHRYMKFFEHDMYKTLHKDLGRHVCSNWATKYGNASPEALIGFNVLKLQLGWDKTTGKTNFLFKPQQLSWHSCANDAKNMARIQNSTYIDLKAYKWPDLPNFYSAQPRPPIPILPHTKPVPSSPPKA